MVNNKNRQSKLHTKVTHIYYLYLFMMILYVYDTYIISIGHRPGLSALSPAPFGRSAERCLAESAATDVGEDAAETARSGAKGGEIHGSKTDLNNIICWTYVIDIKYFWMLLLVMYLSIGKL